MKYTKETRSPEFRLALTAAAHDIDELGHVSNIAYVRWIQDVAVAHSNAVGWTQARYRDLGATFVVRKHEVEYLQSAIKDDQVELVTYVAWWRAATSERHTAIHRARDGALLVRASTLWAFISLPSGRPIRIPKEIDAAFYAEAPAIALP